MPTVEHVEEKGPLAREYRAPAMPRPTPLKGDKSAQTTPSGKARRRKEPTVRLHLWLEFGEDSVFGAGRALLLDQIEARGSLRKAARSLGMSYRAAWGKIQASEQALGVKLIESSGSKRDGCHLSEQGRRMRDMFKQWFEAVEQEALTQAQSIFPWDVTGYDNGTIPPAERQNEALPPHPAEDKLPG